MKTLLIIALLAAPIYGATNEEIETQILALQSTLEEQKADSTATALNVIVQADSTLAANNITVINKPHSNGNYDSMWVGVDFSDSTFSADKAGQKSLAILTLKSVYKGQVNGDIVRVRKDRINAESIAAIADIIK
jgi:lipopolysaccharide export system protein LptA